MNHVQADPFSFMHLFRKDLFMIAVLFVCHGNICRSCMAEFYFKELVEKNGMADCFEIASAATHTDEIWNGHGSPMYPDAVDEMKRRGIDRPDMKLKHARLMTRQDYARYDLLIGMDGENLFDMRRIAGGDPDHKIHLLLDYDGKHRSVADPWYTGDFVTAMNDIAAGCDALYENLISHNAQVLKNEGETLDKQ